MASFGTRPLSVRRLGVGLVTVLLTFAPACGSEEAKSPTPAEARAPEAAYLTEPVAQLFEPELNADSWIMIEIWPDVRDITLSAYFLDFTYRKNRGLCEATKRVFDREQEWKAKAEGKENSSYRLCLSVSEARLRGYFRP